MASTKWTAEQEAAINEQGEILVAAAAGSGKTAVLVERILRRITDPWQPVDVEKFLVVTFTKAAAQEMRERIRHTLTERLFNEPDPGEGERLLRQLNRLSQADITTLHSFCLDLLRRYFYVIGLDPAFRVADEGECALLRQDVLEGVLEGNYALEDPAFLKLVEGFSSDRDDYPLQAEVLRLAEFANSQPDPERWLDRLPLAYTWTHEEALLSSPWGEAIRENISDRLSLSCAFLRQAAALSQKPDGPGVYLQVLREDLKRLEEMSALAGAGAWRQVWPGFREVQFGRLPAYRVKNALSESPWLEQVKHLREEGKKIFGKLRDEYSWDISEQLEGLRENSRLVASMVKLVKEFQEDFAKAKRQRNIVDFSDLEHFTLRLFASEAGHEITANLQDYYHEVLVDEYQDINAVQERILSYVSRPEGNLFMVGDVKQSIYRFRMAEPSLFLNKYKVLPHWGAEAPKIAKDDLATADISSKKMSPDKSSPETPEWRLNRTPGNTVPVGGTENPPYEALESLENNKLSDCGPRTADRDSRGMVIDLARNFRSRKSIIDGVNELFRQIMTEGAGEIQYDEKAQLEYGANYADDLSGFSTPEGPIEIHLLDQKKEDEPLAWPGQGKPEENAESGEAPEYGEAGEDLEGMRLEARSVSGRIKQMVQLEDGKTEFQVYDASARVYRPVRYSDIVILMRAHSTVAPIFMEEFQAAGIPVYSEAGIGYFAANEIETVLSLLKVIDNPRQDIPLAAVLRSPLVGLDGSELGKIRVLIPQGDYYEPLTLAAWAGLPKQAGACPQNSASEYEDVLGAYRDAWPGYLERARELPEALLEKVSLFWKRLQGWRDFSRRNSLAELLKLIYADTGFVAYCGTLPSGFQRQANLKLLYDRALRFEETHYRGLFRFLRFLERFRGQGQDYGQARALGENENVVRIMTVHASKGLEFPVVFLVGLGRKFNLRSLSGKALLHSRLGLGIPLMDLENKIRYPSLIQFAVRHQLLRDTLAEELRILYVALTRAKEKLVLYGSVADLGKALEGWRLTGAWGEALSDGLLRNARSFLDWIGPALSRQGSDVFQAACSGAEEVCFPALFKAVIHRNKEYLAFKDVAGDEGVSKAQSSALSCEDYWPEVQRRLNWIYPFASQVGQPAKTTVSELKRRNFEMEINAHFASQTESYIKTTHQETRASLFTPRRPKFLQEDMELTPAERGTALHTALQHLPFKELASSFASRIKQNPAESQSYINTTLEGYLREYLLTLAERGIMSAKQIQSISPAQIVHFLNTPLGCRLLQARQVWREVPFTLALPCEEGEFPQLIQGVIDVILFDGNTGEVELIDYKTDYLPESGGEEILHERYGLQLAYYYYAVERLLKVKVTRLTIYAFSLGREFDLAGLLIRMPLLVKR